MIQQSNSSKSGGKSGGNVWARTGFYRLVVGAMVAGVALGTLGCDEDDQASATVARASNTIAAINAGGGVTANAPHREDAYDRVIGMLRPVVSSSSGSTKGSAQVITAQALAGKGRIESVRAAEIEDRCSTLISFAHNEADLFAAHSALAAALLAYDPQPEFEDLRTQMDGVKEEIESYRSRVRGIDERITELQQRADTAREEAATRHRHETELRAEAVLVGATERKDLIEEAVGYQREADAFEAEFVMVDAGIEQLRRTRVSVQADLDRLVTQRTLLEEAERNAQRRATVASDESKSAEDAAFEAARRLRTIVREIETMRTGELADAYTEASETLEKAASTLIAGARVDSSREGKDANNVNTGLIQQALGELDRAHATGAAGYAALLSRLEAFTPALPDRNDYLAMLARAEKSRDEALSAASEAFAQAADTIERAGGSEAMRDRLDRIVGSLRQEAPASDALEPDASDPDASEPGATDDLDG